MRGVAKDGLSRNFANDPCGLGQGAGVWGLEVSVGACSLPTRVRAIRWGNARKVPAGP